MSHTIMRLRILITALLLTASNLSFGASILIDFETLPDGSPLPVDTQLTDQFADWGITFDSVPSLFTYKITDVINYLPTSSPVNCLFPGGPAPNHGGTLILDFSTPVTEVGSFFIDDDDKLTVTAFDTNLDPVMTVYSDGSPTGFDSWSISHESGISRVELVGGYVDYNTKDPALDLDAWGIDDLSYTQIPEPATLLLLAVGGLCPSLFSRMRRFKAV